MDRRGFLKIGSTTLLSLATAGISSCQRAEFDETDTLRRLVILYTNDEHGWMEPYKETAGAAGMLHTWKTREGYSPGDKHFLVLSGGDMWTGPALSTAFQGASMVEVMNAMGYRASTIGNHDFDFGLDALRRNAGASAFPFLAANLIDKTTGKTPDFAVPYLLEELNGVQVGVIGLATRETLVDTRPESVRDLGFLEYEEALRTHVPGMRDAGAELVVLISHLCGGETEKLAAAAADLGVAIIGGGHCHEEILNEEHGVSLVESGYFMRGYVRIEILFDTLNQEISALSAGIESNRTRRRAPEISEIMQKWQDQMDPSLLRPIGYASAEIDRKSSAMAQIVLGSWLRALPEADLALATSRYMQQDIYPGDITPASILSVMATDNMLFLIEMSGEEILTTLKKHQTMTAGLLKGDPYTLAEGGPLQSEATYKVIVPHNLYYGGYYYEFNQYDPEPVDTGIHWRDPVINWIRSQGTTRRNPINDLLETEV